LDITQDIGVNMSVKLPAKWKPSKIRAIEYMTMHPNAKMEEVAQESGVTRNTVSVWLRDPEFVEVFYQKYMVSFGAKLPSILNSMIREAESGNVQAGRLVLEHSGKLIKRVEVNNHQSPFEKFLDQGDSKPYEKEEIEEAEFTVIPERPVVPEKKKPKTKKAELFEVKEKARKLEVRREADRWRRRAKRVGVELMPKGRKTQIQRLEWQQEVREAEKAMSDF